MAGFEVLIYGGLLLLTTLCFMKYSKWKNKVKSLKGIPGKKYNSLFGCTLEVFNKNPRDLLQFFVEDSCTFPSGISILWMMFKPYVLIYKAHTVEAVLGSPIHISKNDEYRWIIPWLGTGLLTSTGEKWKTRRKMLTPTFHFKILEDFLDVFNSKSEILASKFKEHLQTGGTFNIFPYVTNCTLDIILETAMGISLNVQQDNNSDYVEAVLKMSEIVQRRFANAFIRPNLIFKLLGYKKTQDEALKILHGLSYRLIKERRSEYKRKQCDVNNESEQEILGKKRRLAFLDLLVEQAEQDGNLTDEDIREEVDTFVFEGHDTTAAAVSFSIYLLGCNPTAQIKVHEELDSIFQGSDRPATTSDLRQMKYLECCIKEALRIYPSVPMIGRKTSGPLVIDGHTIPSGTSLILVPHKIHRDPEYFQEPEKFIPERFSQESSAGRHPYAYVPFSAGPRNCIGQKFALMEEKVVVSTIFRKFRLESITPPEELVVLGELIMRPETSIDVKIYPKEENS